MAERKSIMTTEYLRTSDRYGWKLYSYLRSRTADPKLVEKLYRECLLEFCKCGKAEDEDLLLRIAQRVCVSQIPVTQDRCLQLEPERKGGFGFYVCLTLLIMLIALCLWVILGLLMELGIIPHFNLGHGWILDWIMSAV